MHSFHALNVKLARELREIYFETVKTGTGLNIPTPTNKYPDDYFPETATVLSEIPFLAFLNPPRIIPGYCLK